MVATTRRGWIGVDVGTRALKLAQVEQAGGGLRLVGAAVLPRTGAGSDPDAAQPTACGCREDLDAALSLERRFAGSRTACTMSMHWCQAKTLAIPPGAGDGARSLITDELRCLGCGGDYVFDFWRTGIESTATETHLENMIALAVPRSSATELAGDLARCGLECRVLDALPLAVARAVRMAATSDEDRPVAAFDWGFAEATFCTISGRTPIFVRRLRNGGFGAVLQKAASKLGLDLDEIESLLLDGRRGAGAPGHALGEQLHGAISELAAQPLRAVADELERTFTFLRHQLIAALPEQIWLFGAGALWNGAVEFLASHAGRPVEPWRFRSAGIENAVDVPFPDEVLGPAVSLSALAWSQP